MSLALHESHTKAPGHTHPAQFPPAVQQESPRHPYYNANRNIADKIERWLGEDGHRAWGLVIYRSTYKSNTEWEKFMHRLLADTTESLESMAGPGLLDNLALTIFEDLERFDNASTTVIRDHFKQWVSTAILVEQGPEIDTIPLRAIRSQRYRYCIQITQEMVDSVLGGKSESMPIVRIIRRDWEEYSPYQDGFRLEDVEEPIEGCTLEDVGWMNVPFESVMFQTYSYLRGEWETEYRRPPWISCYP
ncbi:hypothetical protein N7456_002577 [Penicillium angulare]|uniref:Uncharacterized protein n=1 Tax=Penicillium angulare TaxID=116970 RepID=A0A9W9KQG1_9EURO|nr:hypothetical protein N7456_002577 [Penicillium angulare]